MTWRRLGVLVRNLPSTARTTQAVGGEQWTRSEHLLAGVYDAVVIGNWQRGKSKKAKRPKPLPRPGIDKGKRFGTAAMPIDEWRRKYADRFPERSHRTSGLKTTH